MKGKIFVRSESPLFVEGFRLIVFRVSEKGSGADAFLDGQEAKKNVLQKAVTEPLPLISGVDRETGQ